MSAATRSVSARDAAARCGVSERTVRRWIASGRLAADTSGPAFRISLEALDELASRRNGQAADSAAADGRAAALSDSAAAPWTDTLQHPATAARAPLLEALRQLEDLRRENRDLAGQVGYYQRQVQEQAARLLALEAPATAPEPPSGNGQHAARDAILAASGVGTAAEPSAAPRRPWWRVWR